MTERPARARPALSGAAGITALLLACVAVPALASSGIDVHCPETDEARARATADIAAPVLQPPALNLEVTDHGVDSQVESGNELIDTTLVAPAAQSAEPAADGDAGEATQTPRAEAPPATTQLPGVSDADLPRFRRQMFRTDI